MMPTPRINLTGLAQFVVAVLGVLFLGLVAVLAATGAVDGETNDQMAFAAIGGLSALVGQASSWLFRTGNGAGGSYYTPSPTSPAPGPPARPTGEGG